MLSWRSKDPEGRLESDPREAAKPRQSRTQQTGTAAPKMDAATKGDNRDLWKLTTTILHPEISREKRLRQAHHYQGQATLGDHRERKTVLEGSLQRNILKKFIRKLTKCMHTRNSDVENLEMIESYDFGRIVVDRKEYTTDLIIFPNRVKAGWWRKQGHRLDIEDIEEVVEERPQVLIVGTGYSGLMKVPAETKRYLEEQGIELIIQPTKQACETYNELIQSGKRAVAAFHLTC